MQMIPLWTTRQIVKVTQKDFAKFIWRGKRPRLKLKTLTHELHSLATLLETQNDYDGVSGVRGDNYYLVTETLLLL